MDKKTVENEFNEGLKLLDSKEFISAIECFKSAYNFEPNNPKYMSYYGLCIAYTEGNPQVAIELCNRAIKSESLCSNYYYNLGKVYVQSKNRKKSVAALKKALELDKNNSEIVRLLTRVGMRTKSALPFLSRDNPVNIYFGKLKSFLSEL